MANAQIVVTANTRQAQQALGRLNASLGGISSTAALVSSALAGIAVQQATRGILNAVKAYEGFRTQLTTYLGDQQRANAEIERLSKLARTLPQDVNEVTQAFVIFSRFGLDTSNESMRAFSNIAAANSKSIVQLGEAVADALTGEFERLKEFGIKVSKENDQFVARIGDQQVAVSGSTKDLVEQLKALGAEGGRFGSVTVGPLTLAMSNLNGAVIEAQNALGSQGFALAVAEAVTEVTKMFTENDKLITQVGRGLTRAFLYAKEVAILFAKNIDIVGYTLAAVFGIAITRAVLGLAATIAGPLFAAFVLLSKILKATALLAIRHPIIGGIALLVGGINYFTGALDKLGEKLLGLVDDGSLGDLSKQALELGRTVRDEVAGGFEYVSQVQERVNAAEQEFYEKSQEINKSLNEQENTQANLLDQQKQQANLIAEQASKFKTALENQYAQLELMGATRLSQELYNKEKEFEKEIGRKVNEQEREQLRLLVQREQLQQSINQYAQEFVDLGYSAYANRLRALDLAKEAAEEEMNYYRGALDDKILIDNEYYTQRELLDLEYQNKRLQIEQDFANRIRDINLNRIQQQLQDQAGATAKALSQKDRELLQTVGKEERHQQIVRDRIEFEKKSETEKAQWAIEQGANALTALGKYNKTAFEAAKAFNIANAIMNTYMGATKALATYPPPFNFIAAAAVVASGLAQVASIRSQTYSGRQLGGPVLGGTSYMVGENGPELFTPTTNGSITRNGDIGGGAPVNVNFTIVANDTTGFDELLTSREGIIKGIISDAMEERGQRSTV